MTTQSIKLDKVIENLKKREFALERMRRRLFNKAIADCKAIVDLIINRYQPLKIVQWGSLLDFQTFDENSDIDIAVEGIIDAEKYFALLGDAMLLTRFPLDIVQLERIESEFAELILSKGKLIYEHGK